MRIYWRAKPTIICIVLAAMMVRLAVWQADRHEQKKIYIQTLEQRLAFAPAPLTELLSSQNDSLDPQALIFRRVLVTGTFDFEHEMVLRNRRYDGAPGVYVITPLKIDGSEKRVLVSRGFIPLSRAERTIRKQYQTPSSTSFSFVGLVKESSPHKFLAPLDPPAGGSHPWVDQWLRVNIPEMQQQLPYPVLPVWLEMMPTTDPTSAESQIVRTDKGKEELLFLGFRETTIAKPDVRPELTYPVPVFDAVIPAGRHLGYIYEWSFMALGTLLIGLIIQLRPARRQ